LVDKLPATFNIVELSGGNPPPPAVTASRTAFSVGILVLVPGVPKVVTTGKDVVHAVQGVPVQAVSPGVVGNNMPVPAAVIASRTAFSLATLVLTPGVPRVVTRGMEVDQAVHGVPVQTVKPGVEGKVAPLPPP
jgi:hypothetical protein